MCHGWIRIKYRVGLIVEKSINVIYYIKRNKEETHIIIPLDAEKKLEKIQYLFMILKRFKQKKDLSKKRFRREF